MIEINSAKELVAATNALNDWFKSQEIHPSDSMIIMEFFMAKMIIANAKDPLDIEKKYSLIVNTIRSFVEDKDFL